MYINMVHKYKNVCITTRKIVFIYMNFIFLKVFMRKIQACLAITSRHLPRSIFES